MIWNSVCVLKYATIHRNFPTIVHRKPAGLFKQKFSMACVDSLFLSYIKEIPEWISEMFYRYSQVVQTLWCMGVPSFFFFFCRGPHPLLWALLRPPRGKISVNRLAECVTSQKYPAITGHETRVLCWTCFGVVMCYYSVLRTFREKALIPSSWSNWQGQGYHQVS